MESEEATMLAVGDEGREQRRGRGMRASDEGEEVYGCWFPGVCWVVRPGWGASVCGGFQVCVGL